MVEHKWMGVLLSVLLFGSANAAALIAITCSWGVLLQGGGPAEEDCGGRLRPLCAARI